MSDAKKLCDKTIADVERVSDLQEGERAYPEKGVYYDLRPISGAAMRVCVAYIYRNGENLFARTDRAPMPSYRITGTGDTYVLIPRTKK